MTKPITDITLEEMPKLAEGYGLKRFAAEQIVAWLYRERVSSFDEMTNISKGARASLAKDFVIDAVALEAEQTAADGTVKYLCRALDGAAVECVFIPVEDARATVCVSTQVGCAMGCSFCRTGGMGFVRDLTQGEIIGQLILVMRKRPEVITNVVLMGMGEPLANLDAVSGAVTIMTADEAMNLSKRRVTLSTSGLIPELRSFVEKYDIKIAISLNATTDDVRSKLMPVNRRYPIEKIMEFSREYSKTSRHRITFEYVLIRGINDSLEDAKRLVGLLRGVRAKVNLIPLNSFAGPDLLPPKEGTAEKWADILVAGGIQANVRTSRGQEILAACGQLATKNSP